MLGVKSLCSSIQLIDSKADWRKLVEEAEGAKDEQFSYLFYTTLR